MTPDAPPAQSRLRKFLQSWLINTLAVLVTTLILRNHIRYAQPVDLFIASLLLGILNASIRPVMLLVALPFLIFTLGLFTFVINACMLYLVHWLMGDHFEVDSFGWALLGAIIISTISVVLNILTGTGQTQVTFRTHRRPPDDRHDSGNGPVIDV